MASFTTRPDCKCYLIKERRPDGSWTRRSTGIPVGSPGALRKVQSLVEQARLREQEARGDGRPAAFSAWVDRWLEYRYQNPNTYWRYTNAWRQVHAFFKQKRVSHPAEVTYQLCHEYMRWRTEGDDDRKPGAWNTGLTEMRVLGAIMQEAVARGLIMANPCRALKLRRETPSEKAEITDEEQALIEQKLKAEKQWMQDCFAIAMTQGCRLSETRVPLGKVDLRAGTITFKVKGSGGRERTHSAPLHDRVRAIYKRRKAEKAKHLVELPPNPSGFFRRFFHRHGLEHITFHCTRVTVITRLARAGFSEAKTMQYVGHCSDLVHAIYRKLRPDDVRDLVSVLH